MPKVYDARIAVLRARGGEYTKLERAVLAEEDVEDCIELWPPEIDPSKKAKKSAAPSPAG